MATGLNNDLCGSPSITASYGLAIPTAVNEVDFNTISQMYFPSFLEALARVCYLAALPPSGVELVNMTTKQRLR